MDSDGKNPGLVQGHGQQPRLTKKFMILAPVESVKNGDLNSLDILFYNSPVRARRNGSVVRRFTILFALKEEAGKVLLSTSNDFTQLGPGGKASIAGWTPKSSLTEWNSRVGYAPNHKVAFGEYFDNSLPVNSTKRRAESNWASGVNPQTSLNTALEPKCLTTGMLHSLLCRVSRKG